MPQKHSWDKLGSLFCLSDQDDKMALLSDPRFNLCDLMLLSLMPRGKFLSCIPKFPGGGKGLSSPAK